MEKAKAGQGATDMLGRFPMLEGPAFMGMPSGVELLEKAAEPRLINTHMPWSVIGTALQRGKPKIIVVYRNPRDQAVSYFHFLKSPATPFVQLEKFSDFFRLYVNGKCLVS